MAFDGSVFPKHWLRSAIKSSLLFRIRQAYKLFKLYGDFQKFLDQKVLNLSIYLLATIAYQKIDISLWMKYSKK